MPFRPSLPYQDISETGLVDLATEATNAFLNHGTPLGESIEKIARREDLTTHEIHRVIEEANKSSYLSLRDKMASEGAPVFEFDLADRDTILTNLQKTAEEVTRGFDSLEIEEVVREKTAEEKISMVLEDEAQFGTPKQILDRLLADEELEREKCAQRVFDMKCAIGSTKASFVKECKNMILQDGWPLEKIAAALLAARPEHGEFLVPLLGEVRAKADISPGEVKTAGPYYGQFNKAPMISGEPVMVINGSHKLVMDLDTLVEQTNALGGLNNGLYRVDDTIAYLRKNIRNETSKETAKPPHVFNRVERQPYRDLIEETYGE